QGDRAGDDGDRGEGGVGAAVSHANGLTMRTPARRAPVWKSSLYSPSAPAWRAAWRMRAAQEGGGCSRGNSIAATMSAALNRTTRHRARIWTLFCATSWATPSFRVAAAKYSWRTCIETTAEPFARCSANNERARFCLAGADRSSV